MIEPTDEMVQLALDIFLATPTDSIAQIDAGMGKALAAVLAIVARDRCMEAAGHVYHPLARQRSEQNVGLCCIGYGGCERLPGCNAEAP